MKTTIRQAIFLLLLTATVARGQVTIEDLSKAEIVLPAKVPDGTGLRIVGPTEADLDTYVHLEVLGLPPLDVTKTLDEALRWTRQIAAQIHRPPEATEDDVDFDLTLGFKLNPLAWRLTLDVRARVAGDYVTAFALPGEDEDDPVQLALHGIRFGEVVPPRPDPALTLSPSSPFSSSGPPGGPFEPPKAVYVVANEGKGTLQWAAQSTQPWVTAVPSMGVLGQGQTIECHVGLADAAKSLPVGVHVGAISFANQTNGKGNTFRLVSLKVEGTPPPPPTKKLFLILIYQEQDEHTYPRHVSQIIRTEEWEKLRSDPPKDSDSFREWIFDPQSAPGPLRPWVSKVSEKGWKLPVFLLADDQGNLLYGPDMPASVDAAVKLVKDYLPKE